MAIVSSGELKMSSIITERYGDIGSNRSLKSMGDDFLITAPYNFSKFYSKSYLTCSWNQTGTDEGSTVSVWNYSYALGFTNFTSGIQIDVSFNYSLSNTSGGIETTSLYYTRNGGSSWNFIDSTSTITSGTASITNITYAEREQIKVRVIIETGGVVNCGLVSGTFDSGSGVIASGGNILYLDYPFT